MTELIPFETLGYFPLSSAGGCSSSYYDIEPTGKDQTAEIALLANVSGQAKTAAPGTYHVYLPAGATTALLLQNVVDGPIDWNGSEIVFHHDLTNVNSLGEIARMWACTRTVWSNLTTRYEPDLSMDLTITNVDFVNNYFEGIADAGCPVLPTGDLYCEFDPQKYAATNLQYEVESIENVGKVSRPFTIVPQGGNSYRIMTVGSNANAVAITVPYPLQISVTGNTYASGETAVANLTGTITDIIPAGTSVTVQRDDVGLLTINDIDGNPIDATGKTVTGGTLSTSSAPVAWLANTASLSRKVAIVYRKRQASAFATIGCVDCGFDNWHSKNNGGVILNSYCDTRLVFRNCYSSGDRFLSSSGDGVRIGHHRGQIDFGSSLRIDGCTDDALVNGSRYAHPTTTGLAAGVTTFTKQFSLGPLQSINPLPYQVGDVLEFWSDQTALMAEIPITSVVLGSTANPQSVTGTITLASPVPAGYVHTDTMTFGWVIRNRAYSTQQRTKAQLIVRGGAGHALFDTCGWDGLTINATGIRLGVYRRSWPGTRAHLGTAGARWPTNIAIYARNSCYVAVGDGGAIIVNNAYASNGSVLATASPDIGDLVIRSLDIDGYNYGAVKQTGTRTTIMQRRLANGGLNRGTGLPVTLVKNVDDWSSGGTLSVLNDADYPAYKAYSDTTGSITRRAPLRPITVTTDASQVVTLINETTDVIVNATLTATRAIAVNSPGGVARKVSVSNIGTGTMTVRNSTTGGTIVATLGAGKRATFTNTSASGTSLTLLDSGSILTTP